MMPVLETRDLVSLEACAAEPSTSLDGYIAGPNDEAGNPGGDGFCGYTDW